MAYTSLAKIERDKALAQALRGNMGQEILPNWASGLAYVLNQYGANKRSNRAAEMEAENERLYSEDLAAALRGGDELPGPTQSGQPLMRQYQTPQGQMTALQRALQYDQMRNQQEIAGIRGGNRQYSGQIVIDTTTNMPVGMVQGSEFGAPKFYGLDGAEAQWKDTYTIGTGPMINASPGAMSTATPATAEKAGAVATAQQSAQTVGAADRLADANAAALEQDWALWEQGRAQELEETKASAWSRLQGKADMVSTMQDTAERAKDQTNWFSAGIFGKATRALNPGAINLKSSLDTLKANIGFERLQQMRDESPTGGALGQVAVQELEMLQAVWGSLEQSQTPEELKAAIDRIVNQTERSWRRVEEAYQQTYGEPYFVDRQDQPPPAPQPPQGSRSFDDLLREYGASTP